VEGFLDKNPTFLGQLPNAPLLNPDKPPQIDKLNLEAIIEESPDKIMGPQLVDKPWLSRKGQRIDFAQRNAINRQ
jgi:hypothetical protein